MLVFSHIPKTAGSTFNGILRKNYGSKIIAVIPSGNTYSKSDFESDFSPNNYPLGISGHALKPHVDFGKHEENFQWVTFLRDPIERYVSQYLHQQIFNPKSYRMDIVSWSQKYHRSNWQVKWLAGAEDLEKAKKIVRQKFTFVGVVERFDESLQLMNQRLDVPLDISNVTRKNVARDNSLKASLLNDEKLRTLFVEQNELDQQLYDYVVDNVFWNQEVEDQKALAPTSMSYVVEKSRMYGFYYSNYFYRRGKKELVGGRSDRLDAAHGEVVLQD